MKANRHSVRLDHGAALRVPSPNDANGRNALWRWLGDCGFAADDGQAVQVLTQAGTAVARPGDWIVLSVSGDFYVARPDWTN